MNADNFKLCEKLVPAGYIKQGAESRQTLENKLHHLLEQKKWPQEAWDDQSIEMILSELSLMDSNNFVNNCGVGEREARIASTLVAKRHYRFGHGIGRSGDIVAVQPKAAGSSVMMRLTNAMIADALRQLGAPSVASAFVVPVATGMALMLCMLTLKNQRPNAKYVIWPRIDQKSCFKSMVTAGLEPVVIENILEGDELRTDIEEIRRVIERLGAESIVCCMTTTSCFSPRVPDRLTEVAELCKQFNLPHLVNNAYGVQLSKCMHLLQQAQRVGRVDAFVQSTDKNFLVPVGGSVVAGFDPQTVEKIAKMYPGRASSAPTMDLFITLLSLGVSGYKRLCEERKQVFTYLRDQLSQCAQRHGERLLDTSHNPISLAVSLSTWPDDVATSIGSMMFTRAVSGVRVVARGGTQTISGREFKSFGAHHDAYPCSYFTAAAAIGVTRTDVDLFIKRMDKVLSKSAASKISSSVVSESESVVGKTVVKCDASSNQQKSSVITESVGPSVEIVTTDLANTSVSDPA